MLLSTSKISTRFFNVYTNEHNFYGEKLYIAAKCGKMMRLMWSNRCCMFLSRTTKIVKIIYNKEIYFLKF